MPSLYIFLVALHIVAIVVTGAMWTWIDIQPHSRLKPHLHDIRAVHFGSLYLVPWFLGLLYALERFAVPWWHWLVFPCGLGLLMLLSGIGYLFPRPAGLDPFYYWTRGWALVLSMMGLACLVIALLWTAVVLCVYAVASPN